MNKSIIAVLALSTVAISGCSQISSIFKGYTHTEPQAEASTIHQTQVPDHGFTTVETEIVTFDDSHRTTSYQPYTGYDVELYNYSGAQNSQSYYYGADTDTVPSLRYATTSNPRDVAFVKLNGESQSIDWRNCETLNRGYLFLSEYDLRLHPDLSLIHI